MKKILLASILLLNSVVVLFADDLRKRAEAHPLDCAIYLYAQDRFMAPHLMHVLLETGRYGEIFRSFDLSDSYSARELSELAAQLRVKGNLDEANRYLDLGMKVLRDIGDAWDGDSAEYLARELAAMNRELEVLEILENQEDGDELADILLKIAEGFQTAGQGEKAVSYLVKALSLQDAITDPDDLIDIAGRFLRLGQKDKVLEVLSLFEKANDISMEGNRDRLYLEAAAIYIGLGNLEKATFLWQQHRDPDNGFDSFAFASSLNRSGYKDKAEPIFLQLASNRDFLSTSGGRALVSIYLDRGDIGTAQTLAFSITTSNDNYYQHESLTAVADKMLSTGDRNGAIDILSIAENKARKVGEGHRSEDSVGASPLTRKVIYLREIRKRYFKLGLFEKGLALADAIKINDDHAQRFRSEGILDSADLRLRKLSRKKIDSLLKQALDVVNKDEVYYRMEAQVRIISIYVKLSDPTNALEVSNEILASLKGSSYIDDVLPEMGRIFEKSKLRPNAKTRQLLKEIIDEEVGE